MAGTAQDLEQAEWVRAKFLEFGLDQVDVIPYDVLLSYPDMELPNKVYLMDAAGEILYNTSGIQEPLQEPEEGSPLIAPNFNAYSGTGTAQVRKLSNQLLCDEASHFCILSGWPCLCVLWQRLGLRLRPITRDQRDWQHRSGSLRGSLPCKYCNEADFSSLTLH